MEGKPSRASDLLKHAGESDIGEVMPATPTSGVSKVYCGECKWHSWNRMYLVDPQANCGHPKHITFKDTPIYPEKRYGDGFAINANNDCSDFEPKSQPEPEQHRSWWKRLWP